MKDESGKDEEDPLFAPPVHPSSSRPSILYAVVALGWVVFARWVVPPLLRAEHPGRTIAAVKWTIQVPPAPFLPRGIIACWRAFSGGRADRRAPAFDRHIDRPPIRPTGR